MDAGSLLLLQFGGRPRGFDGFDLNSLARLTRDRPPQA
jgi:hypothetical protein